MRARRRDAGGAVLVEFVLILPVFLLLLFGGLDVAITVNGMGAFRSGVDQGASLIAAGDTVVPGDPCATQMEAAMQAQGAPASDAQDATAESLCEVTDSIGAVSGLDLSTLQVAIACENESGVVVPCGGWIYSGASPDPTEPVSFVVCARARAHSVTGLLSPVLDQAWVGATGYGAINGAAATPPEGPIFDSYDSNPGPGPNALYCPAAYAVTYSTLTSSGAPASGAAPVDPGSPYTLGATVIVAGNLGTPGPLVLPGYNFEGWCTTDTAPSPTDCTGTSYLPGSTFDMPAAGVTLYSQWAPGP